MVQYINDLPQEMIAEIFTFLHSKFIVLITSRVCKKWLSSCKLVKIRVKIVNYGKELSNLLKTMRIDNYYAISKLSVPNCEITDFEIQQFCNSQQLVNNLEHLKLRENEISSQGLNLVIDRFYKLKSLDLRGIETIGRDGYYRLVNAKKNLPNLVKLKVDIDFNDQKEVEGQSIKQQIVSLTLFTTLLLEYKPLNNLNFTKLEELELEGFSFNSSILPVGLRKLSIVKSDFVINGNNFEKLETLKIVNSELRGFKVLQKYNLQNLKTLAMVGMSMLYWEEFNNCTEWKPLNLTDLDVSDNKKGWSMIEKLCHLEQLTSLDISKCEITTSKLIQLMGGNEWKYLTRLNASHNIFTKQIVTLFERMPALKFLNIGEGSMSSSDRGVLCALNSHITEINCGSIHSRIDDTEISDVESYSNFLESLSNDTKVERLNKQKESMIGSFDFDKKLKIFIRRMEGLSDRHTFFKSHNNLSFSIQCKLICNEKTKETKYTRVIQHSGTDTFHWDEEITFDSLISHLSCDYLIEFTLICSILNNITGLHTRINISKVNCPIFNSNLELHEGNLKLYLHENSSECLRADVSLSVDFENHDQYVIKYEMEREPPLFLKASFQNNEEFNQELDGKMSCENSDNFVNFLRRDIPFEHPWAIYIAKQYVKQWKKPECLLEILLLIGDTNSLFIKLLIVEILKELSDDLLIDLLPYLVHCLKYDLIDGVLSQFLQKKALSTSLIGNHIFWLLKSESQFYPLCRHILINFFTHMNTNQLETIQSQCLFLDSLEQFKQGHKIQIRQQSMLIPFTLLEVREVKKSLKTMLNSSVNVDLKLVNGECVQLCYSNSKNDRFSFVINSFINLTNKTILKEFGFRKKFSLIGNYPISSSKCLTIIPTEFSKVGKNGSSTFSNLTQSKDQSSNLLLTAAEYTLIAYIFKSQHPTELYISNEGHFVRFRFYQKLQKRILGLVMKVEGLIFPDLEEYLKTNNLMKPFSELVMKLERKIASMNGYDIISSYVKPFISPIQNSFNIMTQIDIDSRLENELKKYDEL